MARHVRRRRRDHPRRPELRSRRRRCAPPRDRLTTATAVRRAARHRRNATQTPSRGRDPWLARCSGLAVLHRAGASLRPKQMGTMADQRCCGAPLKPSRPRCVNTQRRTCHEDRVITTAHGRPPHLHRQLDGISRSATLPDTHVIVAIDDHAVSGVVAASGNTAHVVHCDMPPGPLPVASAAISARSPR